MWAVQPSKWLFTIRIGAIYDETIFLGIRIQSQNTLTGQAIAYFESFLAAIVRAIYQCIDFAVRILPEDRILAMEAVDLLERFLAVLIRTCDNRTHTVVTIFPEHRFGTMRTVQLMEGFFAVVIEASH